MIAGVGVHCSWVVEAHTTHLEVDEHGKSRPPKLPVYKRVVGPAVFPAHKRVGTALIKLLANLDLRQRGGMCLASATEAQASMGKAGPTSSAWSSNTKRTRVVCTPKNTPSRPSRAARGVTPSYADRPDSAVWVAGAVWVYVDVL